MTNSAPTVLITGANRGIGLEFARQYLLEGWRVIAACRAPEHAQQLHQLASGCAGCLNTLALDVSVAPSIAQAAEKLDGVPIDLLLNCAGIMGGARQSLGKIDYADWARVLEVNTLGPVRVLEAFRTHLERSARRVAVTLTSAMGSIAENTSGGWVAYRTSKAALNMAMKCAALDLAARRIVCVVMHPGWVRTDMGGAQAPLSPSESVAAMRRIIGALGSADSGKFLNYDGGNHPW